MNDPRRHKYDYEVDLDGNTAAAKVIRMVGPRKAVLDLGPGPGSITKHLTHLMECDVSAVELDAEAITHLRPHTQFVVQGDLNTDTWPSLLPPGKKYDVVVASDVLEHLYSPWTTLALMKEFIDETGSIVISIPHVGHCALGACLFKSDFSYRDWGLLDRTHIRFFGVNNVKQLFDSAGLKIVDAQFVTIPPEQTEFAEQWQELPQHVRLSLMENPFSNVYQIVIRAVLPENSAPALDITSIPVDAPEKQDSPGPQLSNAPESGRVRLIAFYLPQYHPIPENDLWWGKGFTEWSNVTKAMPLFDGHYQPHLPADLGFYDLRLQEIRHEQITLAKRYGIDGFCYHYYWFSGKRLLDRPLDDMLADRESDMPFCLCWANENWTRRWDAAEHEILIAQEYRDDDDLEFIKSLIPFFRDPRYITLDGAPFFIVYRPQQLPDARRSVDVWRSYAREQGFPDIHIACALTHGNEDYLKFGFDSGVEFPPHNPRLRNINSSIDFYAPFEGHVLPFDSIANSYLNRSYPNPNVFRTVFPSWDNTARVSSRAVVILNGTPANYEYWLSETVKRTKFAFPGEDRFVFINAWNEWAEGCHLEPDRRYGHQFLEATYRASQGHSLKSGFEDRMLPAPSGTSGPTTAAQGTSGARNMDLQAIEAEMARAQEQVRLLEEQISEIYQSTSWRLTAAVRTVGELRNKVFGPRAR